MAPSLHVMAYLVLQCGEVQIHPYTGVWSLEDQESSSMVCKETDLALLIV